MIYECDFIMRKVQLLLQLNREYHCQIGYFFGGENHEKLK